MNTGEYVIRIDAGVGSHYTLVHELVHAGQILTGEIGFNDSGHVTLLGMEDEIKAYQLMYDFEAGANNTPKHATAASILADHPGLYNNLPLKAGKCAVHG